MSHGAHENIAHINGKRFMSHEATWRSGVDTYKNKKNFVPLLKGDQNKILMGVDVGIYYWYITGTWF